MRKVFFIVHLCVVLGDCQLIRGPSNTALIVGQRLELICHPDSNYTVREWTSQTPSRSNLNKIYTGWSQPRIVGSQRFGYIKDNNAIILYLNSTELDDAGTYDCSCQLETKMLEHYSAQLIVLGTEPFCEASVDADYNVTLEAGSAIWMRCRLSFRGNLAPTMEWRQHGGVGNVDERGCVVEEMVQTTVISDTNITSTLSMVIDATYNGTYFTCKTYFQWDNTSNPNTTATNSPCYWCRKFTAANAPDYSYTWTSSVIIVSATTFVQEETTMVSDSTSVFTSHAENGWWLTTVNSCIFALSICVGIVTISICIAYRRKFKSGSTEKAEKSTDDLNPGNFKTINENPTIGDSQAATYLELASSTQESQSQSTQA